MARLRAPTVAQIVPGFKQVRLGYVNAFFVEGDPGLVLVDTGLPGKADVIADAVIEAGHSPGDVSDVIITHCHIDHIGSLAAVAAVTGGRVWVHMADAAVTESGTPAGEMTGRNLIGRLMVFTARPKAAEPVAVDRSLEDGLALDLAGGFTVIHTPGHTPGHVSLLWKPGLVMIAGDAAMNLSGRVGPPPVAEDHAAAAVSFRRLATFDFEVAVFGHGRPVTEAASAVMRGAGG